MSRPAAIIAVFVAAISVGLVAAGCGSGGGRSTVAARRAPFACPAKAPLRIGDLNPRPGVEEEMVPGAPTRMLVCLYSNMDEPDPLGLKGRRATGDRATVRQFAGYLHALPVANPEPHTCPADAGAEALFLFAYPSGPPVVVAANLEGCGSAANGRGPIRESAAIGIEVEDFISAGR